MKNSFETACMVRQSVSHQFDYSSEFNHVHVIGKSRDFHFVGRFDSSRQTFCGTENALCEIRLLCSYVVDFSRLFQITVQ